MNNNFLANRHWSRTHFIDKPEKRFDYDRRKINCFIFKDKRSGTGCRRKARQIEIKKSIALSKVTFHPVYPHKASEGIRTGE